MTAQPPTQGRRPGLTAVLRDTISYVFGLVLIGHQALYVPPAQVNEWFLLLGGSLIGVPGVAEVIAWRGRAGGSSTITGSSPSPPPEPVAPSSSPQ